MRKDCYNSRTPKNITPKRHGLPDNVGAALVVCVAGELLAVPDPWDDELPAEPDALLDGVAAEDALETEPEGIVMTVDRPEAPTGAVAADLEPGVDGELPIVVVAVDATWLLAVVVANSGGIGVDVLTTSLVVASATEF